MGRRRILNITSRKKQDSMRSMYATPFGVESTLGPIIMTGDNDYEFLWVATARDNVISGTEPGVFQQSQRTATSCYMRGLSEKWEISTGSPQPWQHRRIVFTYTGDQIYRTNDVGPDIPEGDGVGAVFKELSSGYARAFVDLHDVSDSRSVFIGEHLRDLVFKGTRGKDWQSFMTAGTDNRRIKIISDKTTNIRSANDRGIISKRRFWIPMNRTLVYDDDENGASTHNSPFSVDHGNTLGDVYIYDMFISGLGGNEDDELQLNAQATLYWHER